MKKLVIIFLLFTVPCFARATNLPGVVSDSILTKVQESQQKANLKGLIHKQLIPVKNDYVNDYDRGTVKYTVLCRNYSFQKVNIPDGTTIKETNFSQKNAHTDAISGKNLHFISCNLNNVEIDPTWTFDGGLRIHSRHRIVDESGTLYDVYEVEKDSKFEEVDREEINN